jgi:hypothetical protein
MKKISNATIVGQQGINLIERIALDIGFAWNATNLDAGIDGYIEIRDSATSQATNCIIQVQSKATEQPFEAETSASFEFRCDSRDLEYWLTGNAPVILIRSRPKSDEAYWVSIKDYFRDIKTKKSGKIVFDKIRDRFDTKAKDALIRLATPSDSGLYLGTSPKQEIIYTNLLEIAPFPEHYFVAQTDYRTAGELFAALREMTTNVRGEWLLNNKTLMSFHNLRNQPWSNICDIGTCDELDTVEWGNSVDPARQRLFVQLLNACLKEKLYSKGIKFSRDNGFYYFRATQDLSEKEYAYQSRENKTSRAVFKGYPKKSDHTKMLYYRHSAFEGRFVRYENQWYLQVTPNYYFSWDGERPSRYTPDLLSGIKRLENNQAVHGQVVMWANVLTERSLFDRGPTFLDFVSLLQFPLDSGLDDASWLKHEDAEKRQALEISADNNGQQRLL